ncbi:GDP-fucose protein O-fucosyltransferase 2-like [Nilaparvata lugens]|uniref:GDP-fucose protein O-fucosyltransferase 2-like n=1 Tax=Nilaparvata lugens TaxID=108931 RepID=UPI00193D051E|nr:GDP-fucose protein O-fucosyltransferase 2-like [Nilaparvata lugens]
MKEFAPVLEMHQFLEGVKQFKVDEVFILQHYKDLFESKDGLIDWKPRWKKTSCNQPDSSRKFRKIKDDEYEVNLWGYKNITAKNVHCISFQGEASLIAELLDFYRPRIAVIDHAEVALHHNFGGPTYWKCRRSMRFNKQLVKLATDFRNEFLNSNDITDKTSRPDDWKQEKEQRDAIGGPYLAVHLRRKDFLVGRRDKVPTLEEAAKQIKKLLEKLNLNTVFVATDSPTLEFLELKKRLIEYSVLRYEPSKQVKLLHKDGGIAIIDQIICSHARYFIGSQDSTFSFRIQEEREILGFDPDSTFNGFCVDSETKCEQPSRWKIIY